MKKLLVYLRDYKKETILGPAFKLLEALLELMVPIVMAAIIDNGIANKDTSYIVRMSLLLVVLGTVGLGFSITAQYFAAKASVGFVKKLRHALFKHIQGLSYAELDCLGTSTMVTRMTSDMNQVQSGMNLTLRLLLRSPFVVFGSMIMAFIIDVKSALVFALTIPVLAIVVFGIMLWCIPLYKRAQERLDKVLGITRENLTGARVIRAFCKEDEEINEFTNRNKLLTKMQKHVGRVSALMNPITYVIINLSIAYLIWVGALQVQKGVITQGAVVALYNYMSQILMELIKLANLIINITKSVACGNRIQAVMEIGTTLQSGSIEEMMAASDVAVEFKDVSLRYNKGGEEALSNISFKVYRGDTIGIIGGTGSGKSSMVNLIPRFYDVSEGEALVNGLNVKEYKLDALRSIIGVVPQKAVLFKGSVRENLKWGRKDASDKELYEALDIAQAMEIVDRKEGGLDFVIEQEGRNLSGGQKQRLTIARALVRKPQILILDDSASALDFATDAALRKAIRDIDTNPTIFIVSQRTSSIQHADNIIVLDDGKIAGMGTHSQLLEDCQVYKEIYESQFKKEGEPGERQ